MSFTGSFTLRRKKHRMDLLNLPGSSEKSRPRSHSPFRSGNMQARRPCSLSPRSFRKFNFSKSSTSDTSAAASVSHCDALMDVYVVKQMLTETETQQISFLLYDKTHDIEGDGWLQKLDRGGYLEGDMLALRHSLAIIGRGDIEAKLIKYLHAKKQLGATLQHGQVELIIPRAEKLSERPTSVILFEISGKCTAESLSAVDRNAVPVDRAKVFTVVESVDRSIVTIICEKLALRYMCTFKSETSTSSIYDLLSFADGKIDSGELWNLVSSEISKHAPHLQSKIATLNNFRPFFRHNKIGSGSFLSHLVPQDAHPRQSSTSSTDTVYISAAETDSDSAGSSSASSPEEQPPGSLEELESSSVCSSHREYQNTGYLRLSEKEFCKYRSDDIIGIGRFGKVFKGAKLFKGVKVVVKESAITSMSVAREIHKEMDRAFLKHLYLVPVIAIQEGIGLLFPYIDNGDFGAYLENHKNNDLDMIEIFRILLQTSGALTYLHSKVTGHRSSIVHRNIKPGNILLDYNMNVKLSDCCLSETQEDDTYYSLSPLSSAPGYSPPKEERTLASDVFSFGVVVLQVLTRDEPVTTMIKARDGLKQITFLYQRIRDACGDSSDLLIEKFVIKDFKQQKAAEAIIHTLAEVGINGIQPPDKRKSACQIYRHLKEVSRSLALPIYIIPRKVSRCLQCCINATSDISVNSERCNNDCKFFCSQCLKSAHRNPLWCPRHGRALPPIGGKKLHALLIAGYGSEREMRLFTKDVLDLKKVIMDPRVIGARKCNVTVVTPFSVSRDPDRRTMKEIVADEFKRLAGNQEKLTAAYEKNLLLYFSGHGKYNSLCVGRIGFDSDSVCYLSDAELKRWIAPLYPGMKQLMIVLDCCFASNLKLTPEKDNVCGGVQFIQWCASDRGQIAQADSRGGSVFTKHLLAGLRSASRCMLPQFHEPRDDEADDSITRCEVCEKLRKHAEVDGYIEHSQLHKYVTAHVLKETCNTQQPYEFAATSEGIKVAYYNEHRLVYTFLFEAVNKPSAPSHPQPLYLSKVRGFRLSTIQEKIVEKAKRSFLIGESSGGESIELFVRKKGAKIPVSDAKTLWFNIDQGNLVFIREK